MLSELFIQAGEMIKKSQRILCISHRRPDGDTLGASNGLYHILKKLGKNVDQACVDMPMKKYYFMKDIRKNIQEFNFHHYDLIFVSDAGASYMTKYHEIYPEMFKGEVPMINLDHHAANDNFGTLNIVDLNSASTTILIYKLCAFLNLPINTDAATALLCGIYNDTGSLKHANTTLEVFEITGKLVELGGKYHLVAKNLFQTTPVSTMKIWGKVLEKASLNNEGVTYSVVTREDFEDAGAKSDELGGVVDFMNTVPNSKFTMLLNEDEKGNVKGSFRTNRDDVDLAKLAGNFGGGGHKKAAGFTMHGRLHREIRWKVFPNDVSILATLKKEVSVDQQKNNDPSQMIADLLKIPQISKGN